jgi:hypothetical protein
MYGARSGSSWLGFLYDGGKFQLDVRIVYVPVKNNGKGIVGQPAMGLKLRMLQCV